MLTNLAVAAIDLALMDGDVDRFIANGGGGIVGLVWILVTIVPALAVLVRRLHDTGKSGWWVLIGFVPFVGTIVLFVFLGLGFRCRRQQVWSFSEALSVVNLSFLCGVVVPLLVL